MSSGEAPIRDLPASSRISQNYTASRSPSPLACYPACLTADNTPAIRRGFCEG